MKKKGLSVLLMCAVTSSMLFAGCGEPEQKEEPSSGNSAPATEEADEDAGGGEETDATGSAGGDFSGITLVFAQDLGTDETANNVTNEILQEYMDKTGVTIQFENQATEADYVTWLTTQFTASQGPDVYSGLIYNMTR